VPRRLAATLLVVALLAGTATAFAVSEQLKLEPVPVTGTRVDKVFSPVCGCDQGRAMISFRLRKDGRVTLQLLDSGDHVVRTLAEEVRLNAGRVTFQWNGRDNEGALVAEATYRPRVRLREHGREINLPNPIRVDTTKPEVTLVSASPREISPDRDGRRESVVVRYRLSERAKALLYVDGTQRVRTRFRPLEGKIDWAGRLRGRGLPAGRHTLVLAAVDPAGNRNEAPPFRITIRYVELARDAIRARVRTQFGVRVRTDAKSFRWRFARASGTARPGLLVLKTPRRPGRYTLYVSANGHADKATVQVVRRPRAPRR
jgi:FlgD Ig-like domain